MNDTLGRAFSFGVQGDVCEAMRVLKTAPAAHRTQCQKLYLKLEKQFFKNAHKPFPIGRFTKKSDLLRCVAAAYSVYYKCVLVNPKRDVSEQKKLKSNLVAICREFLIDLPKKSFDVIEEKLKNAFLKQGIYTLFGIIRPYRSLIAWTVQRPKRETIQLVEGRVKLNVVSLQKFVFECWMFYATGGHKYPGGWASSATKGSIFNVLRKKRSHESYQIDILKHEGQHAFDLQRFPKLHPIDLEYRAKLAELVACRNKMKRLEKFFMQSAPNVESPHAAAAFELSNAFRDLIRLKSMPRNLNKLVQDRARVLLLSHTAEVLKNGRRSGVLKNKILNRLKKDV